MECRLFISNSPAGVITLAQNGGYQIAITDVKQFDILGNTVSRNLPGHNGRRVAVSQPGYAAFVCKDAVG